MFLLIIPIRSNLTHWFYLLLKKNKENNLFLWKAASLSTEADVGRFQSCFMLCLLRSHPSLPLLPRLLQLMHAAPQNTFFGVVTGTTIHFESLHTSAEQLSKYTKIQEFRGLAKRFCALMPPLVNNLIIFFPFFSKFHLPHFKITGKAQSQHLLEASHFKISVKVTEGRNCAKTFYWFLSYRF